MEDTQLCPEEAHTCTKYCPIVLERMVTTISLSNTVQHHYSHHHIQPERIAKKPQTAKMVNVQRKVFPTTHLQYSQLGHTAGLALKAPLLGERQHYWERRKWPRWCLSRCHIGLWQHLPTGTSQISSTLVSSSSMGDVKEGPLLSAGPAAEDTE